MTAHGFTAGPWALGKGYGLHGVEVVGDNGNRMICGVIGVDADTHDPDGRKTGTTPTPDGWANARLIAAAPDLLAALLHMRVCASCAEGDWEDCEGGRAANEAIAAATGSRG